MKKIHIRATVLALKSDKGRVLEGGGVATTSLIEEKLTFFLTSRLSVPCISQLLTTFNLYSGRARMGTISKHAKVTIYKVGVDN